MRVPPTRDRQLVSLHMSLFMALTVLWALLASTILAYSQTSPSLSSDKTPDAMLDRRDRLGTPIECADVNRRTPRTDGVNLFCPDDDLTMENRGRRPNSPVLNPPPIEGAPSSTVPGGTIQPSPPSGGPLPGGPLGPPSGGLFPGEPASPSPGGGTLPSTPPAGGGLAQTPRR